MPGALGDIGKFFSGGAGQGLGDIAKIGSAGAGLLGNISAEHQRSQALGTLKQNEALLSNPQALSQEVAGMTQPLNQGLVQSVGNQVNANLAEQGLSQSPGISASVLAQALAPYQQQNQSTAYNILMQRLGLPVNYGHEILGGLPQGVNLAPLLALFQQGQGGQGGAAPVMPGAYGGAVGGSPGAGIDPSVLAQMFGAPGAGDFPSAAQDFNPPGDIWGQQQA